MTQTQCSQAEQAQTDYAVLIRVNSKSKPRIACRRVATKKALLSVKVYKKDSQIFIYNKIETHIYISD